MQNSSLPVSTLLKIDAQRTQERRVAAPPAETPNERLARRWTENLWRLRGRICGCLWLASHVPKFQAIDDLIGELSLRLAKSADDDAHMTDSEWLRNARRQALRVTSAYTQQLATCTTRIELYADRFTVVECHDNPSENAQERESASLVRRAMDALDQNDREVVERLCCEGESYTSVLTNYGGSRQALRRHAHRVCATIGSRLANSFGVPLRVPDIDRPNAGQRSLRTKETETIRRRYSQGVTGQSLADAVQISRTTVSRICDGVKSPLLSVHSDQIDELRKRRRNGETRSSLARRFSVSTPTIDSAVNGTGGYAGT